MKERKTKIIKKGRNRNSEIDRQMQERQDRIKEGREGGRERGGKKGRKKRNGQGGKEMVEKEIKGKERKRKEGD